MESRTMEQPRQCKTQQEHLEKNGLDKTFYSYGHSIIYIINK